MDEDKMKRAKNNQNHDDNHQPQNGESSSSTPPTIPIPINVINSTPTATAPFPADTSDDELDFTTRYDSDLELEHESPPAGAAANDNQLPLIPTDFSSITEAIQNFTAVFESRYGAQHAPFYDGSLPNAITEAFEAPGRDIEERRPLAIYLHNDNAVAAHIFAQSVMSSMEVSNLLKCQFIVWAWDVTQHQNRQHFFEWLSMASLSSLADSIKLFPQTQYPLLILLAKERGVITRTSVVYGHDDVSATVIKLLTAMDQYRLIKQQESADERNRMEREQFRQEQVEEYQRGLAADRAKQEELRKKRQKELEEEQQRQRAETDKHNHRKALATVLPTEPEESDPNVITIRLRMPNGKQIGRRFRFCESVEMLLIYAETLGYDKEKYRLWTSDMPKKELTKLDTSKSFEQLNWSKREMVTIEEM